MFSKPQGPPELIKKVQSPLFNPKNNLNLQNTFFVSYCLSVLLSLVSLSISLSVYISLCLCIFLSVYISVCLYFCLSIFLSVYISVCLYFCLSIFLSVFYKCCKIQVKLKIFIYVFVLKNAFKFCWSNLFSAFLNSETN